MPDEMDLIQERVLQEQMHLQELVARRAADANEAVQQSDCLGCGDEIPTRRIAILPGVKHCVTCAERLERV